MEDLMRQPYFPYRCRDDAVEEYRSLRAELLECQKQRVALFQYSILLIIGIIGFFADGVISPVEALLLVAVTIPSALFSYSTRTRDRRIASYIGVFLADISPWSRLSTRRVKLKLLQRTSVAIVVTMILLDVVFLSLSLPAQAPRLPGLGVAAMVRGRSPDMWQHDLAQVDLAFAYPLPKLVQMRNWPTLQLGQWTKTVQQRTPVRAPKPRTAEVM